MSGRNDLSTSNCLVTSKAVWEGTVRIEGLLLQGFEYSAASEFGAWWGAPGRGTSIR